MPCVNKSRVGALCEGGSVAARVARAHDWLHVRQRQHRHLVTIHRHVSHIDSAGAVLSGQTESYIHSLTAVGTEVGGIVNPTRGGSAATDKRVVGINVVPLRGADEHQP